jgi:Eukaryotic initiation factor 4E
MAPTSEDWRASMKKVGWFKDIITFWQIWSTIPISHLENYFYDQSEQMLPIFKIDGNDKRISSIGIFQSGVKPEWEDVVNKGCVEIRAKIPGSLTMKNINTIWEDVVVDLVTNKMSHA